MKRVKLIATGGTIACKKTEAGLEPCLSGEELLKYVPEVEQLCGKPAVDDLFNIDSTNVTPDVWVRIAEAIRRDYDQYDAFLVTHGTDTMAYTAAALSYLIQNSPKPIVITGSQHPINETLTDAKRNLYDSVLYATDGGSHDVALVFGGAAIAGTRASKRRTASHNAFESVNFPTLATLRGNRILRYGDFDGGRPSGELTFYERLNPRVQTLKLTPGMNPAIFEALKPYCDALIVEGFGLGGTPNFAAYQDAVFKWLDSKRIMVASSQAFEEGFDMGVYEVGSEYVKREDLLMSGDMTCEAMTAKLMWALGQTTEPGEVKELFLKPVNHDRAPW